MSIRSRVSSFLSILILLSLVAGCNIDQEPVIDGMGVSKHLEKMLATDDERLIDKFMEASIAAGGDGVPYIIKAWKKNTDVESRCRLASVIEGVGPEAADMVPYLLEELDAIDELRVSCAAMALGGIGPAAAPAVERLGDLLRASDYSTQASLLYALGGIGEASASQVQLIKEAVEREQTSAIALKALSRMGEAGVHAIEPWMESESAQQRLWAAEVLSGMPPKDVSMVLDPLAKLLRDKDPRVRIQAAKALGGAGSDALPVYQNIVHALRDSDEEVREAVVQALIRIGPVGGKELINALTDKYWYSREGAARVIGTFSSLAETAKSNLITALNDSNVKVRVAVINALTILGPSITNDMILQLRSNQLYRKFGGARVLGNIGPPARAALPDLQKLLQDRDALVRKEAQDAILKISGER